MFTGLTTFIPYHPLPPGNCTCEKQYITSVWAVLGLLLLKSSSLHIALYFEATLCITVTYYFKIKVTSNILY